MEKVEPKIIAPGWSDDEIYDWMDKKVGAKTRLNLTLELKESCQETLLEHEENIKRLQEISALHVLSTEADPTPHPEGL